MKIEREDVNRMKELARKVAHERNKVKIHELEVGFKHNMAAKYGEKTAITMLTKIWAMADRLKRNQDGKI